MGLKFKKIPTDVSKPTAVVGVHLYWYPTRYQRTSARQTVIEAKQDFCYSFLLSKTLSQESRGEDRVQVTIPLFALKSISGS